jgi:cell division protein FtsW (lipid II flippase)
MTRTVVARVRSFLVRGVAVVVVVLTYALVSVGTQVLSVPGVTTLLSAAGVSSVILTTTATPADARRRRRRRHRRWASWFDD